MTTELGYATPKIAPVEPGARPHLVKLGDKFVNPAHVIAVERQQHAPPATTDVFLSSGAHVTIHGLTVRNVVQVLRGEMPESEAS